MTIVKFRVDGLPPKKDGANSMWGKRLEAERLVNLRRSALLAMNGRPSLKRDIRLTVTVCVGVENKRSIGDLDTFVTGVCDGLMKSAPRCKLCLGVWDKPENGDIHPDRVIAINDDCQVMSMQADKIVGDTDAPWYEVTLEAD
ncbi:MAG: hypothetical protein HQ578_00020 [Chloroflexi bacterium]|nr:hypothetical protein [Chloroflexota bacterium]